MNETKNNDVLTEADKVLIDAAVSEKNDWINSESETDRKFAEGAIAAANFLKNPVFPSALCDAEEQSFAVAPEEIPVHMCFVEEHDQFGYAFFVAGYEPQEQGLGTFFGYQTGPLQGWVSLVDGDLKGWNARPYYGFKPCKFGELLNAGLIDNPYEALRSLEWPTEITA